MQFEKIEIEGYRSIRRRVILNCDPSVTVILGANDHGKTNLLEAMLHLNSDQSFDRDRDLNWDCADKANELPKITYYFRLDESERRQLGPIAENVAKRAAAREMREIEQRKIGESEKKLEQLQKLENLTAAELVEDTSTVSDSAPPDQQATMPPAAQLMATARKVAAQGEVLLHQRRWQTAYGIELAATVSLREGLTQIDPLNALTLRRDEIETEQEQLETEKIGIEKRLRLIETRIAQLQPAGKSSDLHSAQSDQSAMIEMLVTAGNENAALGEELVRVMETIEAWQGGLIVKELAAQLSSLSAATFPEIVTFERAGVSADLRLVLPRDFDTATARSILTQQLPRVELIRPVSHIADATSLDHLSGDDSGFMRGIFYYAGLSRNEWDSIFEQNDTSMKRLSTASDTLNKTLKGNWSQGRELKFILHHNSKSMEIELLIEDPAVADRYVRASRRSTGFTYFFALRTILYARETEAKASSYLWLFDEPGLHLHPFGQQDLLQVIETLSRTNQILYSTHSIFMINKNFPVRHRMLSKSDQGTTLDGKPYVGQWRAAIEGLGLSLPGTILFASSVLLVEGDSDPIFINAMLQKLIEVGRSQIDVNAFSALSTGESKNADALIRILGETAVKPRMASVFDGDEGGRSRAEKLRSLFDSRKIPSKLLVDGTTLEDHLPFASTLYLRAVAVYVAKITKVSGAKVETILKQFQQQFLERYKDVATDEIAGIASWSRSLAAQIGQLDEEPSPVGIAREYSLLLSEASVADLADEAGWRRAEGLCEWISEQLKLPAQTIAAERILAQ